MLLKISSQLGKTYPHYIDGKYEKSKETFSSINPSNKSEIVAKFYKGTRSQAIKAILSADKAFNTWQHTTPLYRSTLLRTAAEKIRSRRYEINSWIIKEVGKNYLEADADLCESVDFLEWNSRENLRCSKIHELIPTPGERNFFKYIPIGVVSVIPPWNFPFAILMGITSAALVTGNTVVLKPSSDSPMIGKKIFVPLV